MPKQSVEKRTFLCYPFSNHVTFLTAKDHSRYSRNIVAFGRGHMAGANATGPLGTIFFCPGKRRHGSGAFRACHALVYC